MKTVSRKALDALYMMHSMLYHKIYWLQGEMARNKSDDVVSALNSDAVCWCLYGAYDKAVGGNSDTHHGKEAYGVLLEQISKRPKVGWFDEPTLIEFNDSHTHGEVLDAIEQAIIEQEKVVYK